MTKIPCVPCFQQKKKMSVLPQKTEAEGGEEVVLWFFVWFYLKIFKCGWTAVKVMIVSSRDVINTLLAGRKN